MYTPYYGFREKPFALSPDPRFLFLSASHREVLGHLVYGIEQGEGFMAISGEVGTGKTTLCRTLLRRLGSESEVAFIFNPTLTPLELLKAINSEFELSTFGNSRPELTDVLNTFLLEKRSEGRGVLLIVDEAQNLSTETLEQLRLLSNLETETSKLLQIVLLGQPELDEKLATKELRQLRQRISVWWHLGPLDAAETREYVRHRLRVAGALERPIFTDAALRAVHQISRGVPRVVNLLCDRALLAGYADQKAQIGRRLVLRAAVELRPQRSKRGLRRAWIGATALALLLFGGVALTQVGSWSRKDSAGPPVAAGSPVEAPVAMSREWADVSAAKPPTPNRPRPMAIVDGELDPVLAWQTPEQSRAETLHATLAAWDLPIAELDVTSFEALRSALASRGIALLPILPELPALRDAGTPAIVSLRDRSGVPRLALLRSLAGDTAHVAGLARGRPDAPPRRRGLCGVAQLREPARGAATRREGPGRPLAPECARRPRLLHWLIPWKFRRGDAERGRALSAETGDTTRRRGRRSHADGALRCAAALCHSAARFRPGRSRERTLSERQQAGHGEPVPTRQEADGDAFVQAVAQRVALGGLGGAALLRIRLCHRVGSAGRRPRRS
jgi:general secretion pathway protein A